MSAHNGRVRRSVGRAFVDTGPLRASELLPRLCTTASGQAA